MGCCKDKDQISFPLIVGDDVAEQMLSLLHNPFKDTFPLTGCLLSQPYSKEKSKVLLPQGLNSK